MFVNFCRPRCIGFARRRVGRGGRILLDRSSSNYDDVWSRLDYTIFDTQNTDNNNTESRLPVIIENKLLEGTAEKVIEGTPERVLGQSPLILNNHQHNNIVIKSEYSKNQEISDDQTDKLSHGEKSSSASNQKLDDFEQLLDSASASSNIINKKLVCKNNSDISDDSFLVMTATGSSTLSHNEILTKNSSVGLLNSFNCEASSSGVSSTNGSLSFSISNSMSQSNLVDQVSLEANKQTAEDDEEGDEIMKPESPACQPEDFYLNFIDEIKNEWLHFRPKTPPIPLSPSREILFDSDLTDRTKKFSIELQMLDERFKETEVNSYIDNIYMSQPMSVNLSNKSLQLNEDTNEHLISVKTEPTDRDYEFIDEMNSNDEDSSVKQSVDSDAVRKLLEKYQNDITKDDTLELDIDDIDFDDCVTSDAPVGCSNFKLLNEDLEKTFKPPTSQNMMTNKNEDGLGIISIKTEADNSSDLRVDSTQHIAITKEAPIAELQSHNYVLQYGSPVSSNTVTLNSIPSNANILTCSSNLNVGSSMDTGITPATTLFQQQFINSGNTIITAQQQNQQNKLQPIVYDSNTIVLAATQARKQMNGPSDRNCNYII